MDGPPELMLREIDEPNIQTDIWSTTALLLEFLLDQKLWDFLGKWFLIFGEITSILGPIYLQFPLKFPLLKFLISRSWNYFLKNFHLSKKNSHFC